MEDLLYVRASFSHFLRLGGFSIPSFLNLEIWMGKIHRCALILNLLALFLLYRTIFLYFFQ